ncbi:MAG: nucleotidyltransferase domain-containing protein [bacterium]|nr:nucleotidyltransferase domain-containing protein [bacterium]
MRTPDSSRLRPLDFILSAPSHLAILRVLRHVREGLSGREIARRARINHQTCALSLLRLEKRGVVRRLGAGRNQLFALNRENILVREVLLPLLAAEYRIFELFRQDIARIARGRCVSAVLFGSVARGLHTATSDYDIILVVSRRSRRVSPVIREIVACGMERWGFRISPIVMSVAEFSGKSRGADRLIRSVLRDGITLFGEDLRGVAG